MEGTGPKSINCVSVMGAAKTLEGLAFFASVKDLRQLATGKFNAQKPTGGSMIYSSLEDAPPDDAAKWIKRGWTISAARHFPLCFFTDRGELRCPTASELNRITEWMEALAATCEADVDTGCWEVALSTGEKRVLTLPNLLEPKSAPASRPSGGRLDLRIMESLQAKISRYFEEHPAGSIDEMNRVLQEKFVGQTVADLPEAEPRSAAEQAQELCFQAFETSGRRQVILARQAREIDPDCADAHNLLAEAAYDATDAFLHYERGLAAAVRSLGSRFEESRGNFWLDHATRPYMRARLGCAHSLASLGRLAEAVAHAQDMLQLNPNDNQGIRYSLLGWLLRTNADEQAGALLKQFDEESTQWCYARALLAFRLSGNSAAAASELAAALKANHYVVERLLANAESEPVAHYSPGSPEEAVIAADELRPAFAETPGALRWLAENYRQAIHAALAKERAAKQKLLVKKLAQQRGQKKRK